MSNNLEIEVEKINSKGGDIELEGEGKPRRYGRTEEYLKGYNAGWMTAKKNLLKKLSGEPGGEKKKDEAPNWVLGLIIVGVLGTLVFIFVFGTRNNESNRNTPTW